MELGHIIGCKDEKFSMLPDLPAHKQARRDYSDTEKSALIEEKGRASNHHKLDLQGTHYEQQAGEVALIDIFL